MKTVGPILSPVLDATTYSQVAVWNTRKSAVDWAILHGWKARDAFRINAGSRNMSFTQWILRDASGFALTERGYLLATELQQALKGAEE